MTDRPAAELLAELPDFYKDDDKLSMRERQYRDILLRLDRAEQATDPDQVEYLCEVMHDAYEMAAPLSGWETQKASRKPWADVPEANKETMRAAVGALLADLRAAQADSDESS